MSQVLAEQRVCANYDCKNLLSSYELERISTSFTRYIYCRTCRYLYRYGRLYENKCRDCGAKIDSSKMVCAICRKQNKTGFVYFDKKCEYRNCQEIIPRTSDGRKKYCCHSHCNSESQFRWKHKK